MATAAVPPPSRPCTDSGAPPPPSKVRGASATVAVLAAPPPAEEHHEPAIRWSKDIARGFVKKTQSFAFGCVPLQGIWLIYTLVLVGFIVLGAYVWSYCLNQVNLYLAQRGQPLRCENNLSEIRTVDTTVLPGDDGYLDSLACYITTYVYECGSDTGEPLSHNATCPLPEGATERVNVEPTQLGADDIDRPDADCTICYADKVFYRRIMAEQLLDPQCRASYSDAQAEFRMRCESLVDLPPYRCWLGLEGTDEHGQIIAYDGDIDGFPGTDSGRIAFPVKMVILASVVTVLYALYLVKKFMEASVLWLETQKDNASGSKEAVAVATPVTDPAEGQFDDAANAKASVLFEFSCVQHAVYDIDESVKLEVVRRGYDHTQTVVVPYRTQNISMDAENYIATEGQLVFPAGTDRQTITVAFGKDAGWQNVAVMAVRLGTPKAATQTDDDKVGLGLHRQSTVAICNTTKFPNDLEGDLSELGLLATVTAFFTHVWRLKRKSFLKCLAYKMGEPLCYLIRKCIELRLFDNTLDLEYTADFPLHSEWTRERELSALAFIYVLVFLLDWYLEIWHELWAPVNSVRTLNRKAVFTKMLYLDPHMAQTLSLGKVHEMMQTAVEEAAYHAWYTFSMAIATAIKIMVQLGFLIYIGSYEESKTILIVIPLLFVFEVSLYAVRIKHGTVLQREYIKKEGERIDFTNAGLNSRAVMLRYNQIEPAGQKFDALHSAEMWARFQFLLYNFNTAYLGRLVPVLMYALCMNVMGNQALSKDSEVKIGDVVLVLSTLTGFSSSIGSLANRLAKVGRGFLGVQILAEFFNLPSILDASLQTTRLDNDKEPCSTSNLSLAEQNKNAELHEALRKEQEQKPLDEQEVVVKNAMFDIDLKTEGVQSYAYNVVLKQGTFSLLLGAEGSGKTTLLKLLEGELQVDGGAIFTPAHLARRLVTLKEKNTVRGTILENILFGVSSLHAAKADPTWSTQQLRASAIQHGWVGCSVSTLSGASDAEKSEAPHKAASAATTRARVSELLEVLDESEAAREALATEMKDLAIHELSEMAREFGLHRNGKPTMAEMLAGAIETLSVTQASIVAVMRAILAGTDILLLDGIFDELHASTLARLVRALQHWQETRGASAMGLGSSTPKTIAVVVRNSLTPVTVMELCPTARKIESLVASSHHPVAPSSNSGSGTHVCRQVSARQLSPEVPRVPHANEEESDMRGDESLSEATPPLPPLPTDPKPNP